MTFTFADSVAPEVDITAPVDGATYIGGEPIIAWLRVRGRRIRRGGCAGTAGDGAEPTYSLALSAIGPDSERTTVRP